MTESTTDATEPAPRPRGRPRRDIDLDTVADAVADLFAEGGLENVSIGATSEKLSVSRATLYRTVPTREDLLGILFERSTRELTASAEQMLSAAGEAREQLVELVSLQVQAAIGMRRYMAVFFGGGGLPPDVLERWHDWSRSFEAMWLRVVTEAMEAGVLAGADPVVTTRLVLGMCIWISRWYRPDEGWTREQITGAALSLLRL